VESRARMDALMGFAQQDPELMQAVSDATNPMTGEFNWSKVARALGEEGWNQLEKAAQFRTDEWLIGKGIRTPGMEFRYARREMGQGGGPGGAGAAAVGPPEEKKPLYTSDERREYYMKEHPGLQNPAMAELLNDPQALDILAKKELYGNRGPASGFATIEQQDWAQGKERPWAGWAGGVAEEKQRQEMEARQAALRMQRQRMGPRSNAPRR